MDENSVTLRDIWKAKRRIAPYVQQSPLIFSERLSEVSNRAIYLKLENLHASGSFKIRGATNKILSLTEEERKRGVTTFSTGNFGVSVAMIAKQLDIPVTVCISGRVPQTKVSALQRSGAKLEVYGQSQDDAAERCEQLSKSKGLTVLHPFDDSEVIAGQGTIGLEVIEELPEVDTIIGGLSGGGLHSGVGVTMKTIDPTMNVIGLSPKRSAAMYESIKAGKPLLVEEQDTYADSLLGGIGLNNQFTFSLVQKYVDDIILLEEEDIATGMHFMLIHHRMAIEGAAACGIGAIINKKVKLGSHNVIIISGNSVGSEVLFDILQAHHSCSEKLGK
ncbi:pyridoxal-phosphate dependent enzyme [Virgibacillus sp. SK37]|uniref:pyridoxal-phosphate dependent enzyme n=1 Tax=Virgibacillus sp. SK37 TaxID=403957 RepID=UPI0004D1398A|nr:pyridoxal-phosphate dependent enzyme [Virgibacillus sp. SK37]AIF44274.1 threonine dehydratase [Virgibacillus sp. SK37]